MTDLRSMPRPTIALAGLVIGGCAIAGLALGLMRDLKSRGAGDLDTGDVVAPIKTVANATPLTSPPVTEADVRRWVHEELASRPAAPAAKKPRADNGGDPDGGDGAASPLAPPASTPPAAPAPSTPKNQTAQQIPF